MAAIAKIDTLKRYHTATQRILRRWHLLDSTGGAWFRGQAGARWSLLPSIYRPTAIAEHEREMLRDFRLQTQTLVERPATSDVELLAIMQHYGAPTRLIDWSDSNLVGLYFAVSDATVRSDGTVWVLDPWSLNEVALNQRSVPAADDKRIGDWVIKSAPNTIAREVDAEWPVAVRPMRGSSRIVAQRGSFTVHGRRKIAIDKIPGVRIEKLVIDRHAKAALLKELWTAGVAPSSIFPGLEGVAREVAYRYGPASVFFEKTGENFGSSHSMVSNCSVREGRRLTN